MHSDVARNHGNAGFKQQNGGTLQPEPFTQNECAYVLRQMQFALTPLRAHHSAPPPLGLVEVRFLQYCSVFVYEWGRGRISAMWSNKNRYNVDNVMAQGC